MIELPESLTSIGRGRPAEDWNQNWYWVMRRGDWFCARYSRVVDEWEERETGRRFSANEDDFLFYDAWDESGRPEGTQA
jgi:hypothetical protein